MNSELDCGMLADFLDGSLDQTCREQFRAHMRVCPSCSERVNTMQAFEKNLREAFDETAVCSFEEVSPFTALHLKDVSETAPPAFSTKLWLHALAASTVLAVTIGFLLIGQSKHAGKQLNKSEIANHESSSNPSNEKIYESVYAEAHFGKTTFGVLKCDEPELTVFQVFPKMSYRELSTNGG